uniref:Uncharacterized protein n=1 Tax=Solanum lycopersicum TaxID=4081 RepID=A0A3Q7H471_SOLLC
MATELLENKGLPSDEILLKLHMGRVTIPLTEPNIGIRVDDNGTGAESLEMNVHRILGAYRLMIIERGHRVWRLMVLMRNSSGRTNLGSIRVDDNGKRAESLEMNNTHEACLCTQDLGSIRVDDNGTRAENLETFKRHASGRTVVSLMEDYTWDVASTQDLESIRVDDNRTRTEGLEMIGTQGHAAGRTVVSLVEDYTWDVASTQDLGRTNSQSIKHRDDGLQHPGVLLPHLLADIREALLMHPIWDSHNALLESLLCKYQDLAVCPPIRTQEVVVNFEAKLMAAMEL